MFAQFVLAPLIGMYRKPEFFSEEMPTDKQAELKAHSDIKTFFTKQMPLNKAVLAMVCKMLPAPPQA